MIHTPRAGEMFFLPQQPFMPLGTLRQQLLFPSGTLPELFVAGTTVWLLLMDALRRGHDLCGSTPTHASCMLAPAESEPGHEQW